MIKNPIKILAFSIVDHDSNACFWDGERFRYMKSERIEGEKHHVCDIGYIKKWAESHNFKPNLVVFTDGHRNVHLSKGQRQGQYDLYKEVMPVEKDEFWDVKTICVDHSYAHILSAWPIIDSENVDIGIACDGNSDYNKSIAIIKNPSKVKEASFHKTWGNGRSIGKWFKRVGRHMGMKCHQNDYAGKIMGLQSYGNVDDDFIKSVYPSMLQYLHEKKDKSECVDPESFNYAHPDICRDKDHIKIEDGLSGKSCPHLVEHLYFKLIIYIWNKFQQI